MKEHHHPADPRTWYDERRTHTLMWNQIRRVTPLTDRERDVLRYVIGHVERHGYAPTVREVGAHFRWSSTRTAGEHLHNLARKGALQITPGIARGIRVEWADAADNRAQDGADVDAAHACVHRESQRSTA